MKTSTLAPAFVLLAGLAVACGGPDTSEEGIDMANVVAAPSGPSGSSGGDTTDWWAIYDVLLDSVWDVVCDQWEIIRQGGVYAFCESYLDSIGVPETGFRRIVARRVCARKVNRAIDEAVCTITDFVEDVLDGPEDGGDGGDEGPAGPSGPSGPSGP